MRIRINILSNQIIDSVKETTTSMASTVFTSNDGNEEEYDVFVSHAWEDKEDFVEEFVQELRNLGIKVWYDTSRIKWGDSMRVKIDDGLKKSRFGVAVLSPKLYC